MADRNRMSSADTGLLVIDVQEKLVPLIPDAIQMVHNIAFLLDAAKVLEMKVVATEQYPKGLGPTVEPLRPSLPIPFEKMTFSCGGNPNVVEAFHRAACPKVLLMGMESHVCVQQTALEFLNLDFRVFVAVDAIACRYPIDHEYALRRMEQAGATLTTSEAAAFEWAGESGTPAFKQISRLVQERMKTLAQS